MKVLIIEDDKFISTIYESELHQLNVEVVLAYDGVSGLQTAKEIKPDLILLDLILPRLNGFEVLRELKLDEQTKTIPVIINSALKQEKDIQEAIGLGALLFLPKDSYSQKQVAKEILDMLMTSK
jgi:DNA-binding response OmpR family regulator